MPFLLSKCSKFFYKFIALSQLNSYIESAEFLFHFLSETIVLLVFWSELKHFKLIGEFDSGSERTLAAWFRHASRTVPQGTVAEGLVTRG